MDNLPCKDHLPLTFNDRFPGHVINVLIPFQIRHFLNEF